MNHIEQLCQKYLKQIQTTKQITYLLTYDPNNIDLQVKLLKLHYEILEIKKELKGLL